jgi:hypothetical protein
LAMGRVCWNCECFRSSTSSINLKLEFMSYKLWSRDKKNFFLGRWSNLSLYFFITSNMADNEYAGAIGIGACRHFQNHLLG